MLNKYHSTLRKMPKDRKSQEISLLQSIQTSSEAQPDPYSMGTC
jgi:hypothetical protein